jgi:uncharacterized lipoprotein YajG
MKMFHVERLIKTLFKKGFLVFIIATLLAGCIAPRQTVEIHDYVLVPNGKEVLGRQKGLTAFMFENNPRKMPFVQFVADKYNVGKYQEVDYWVMVEGQRLRVYIYDNAELEKYFDTSAFMVTNVEPNMNIVGSTAKFIAVSVTNQSNEDCLEDSSLYQKLTTTYLKDLKDEYNNL